MAGPRNSIERHWHHQEQKGWKGRLLCLPSLPSVFKPEERVCQIRSV
ncbi:hypothetical protein GbCGDNIH4_7254 [Granulibacter bethesdensis CGDNIH4]|nr:hypothetical protein GbCGDNIH4_7254 [Granulibacter bethesdensis CGDNIH4]